MLLYTGITYSCHDHRETKYSEAESSEHSVSFIPITLFLHIWKRRHEIERYCIATPCHASSILVNKHESCKTFCSITLTIFHRQEKLTNITRK